MRSVRARLRYPARSTHPVKPDEAVADVDFWVASDDSKYKAVCVTMDRST